MVVDSSVFLEIFTDGPKRQRCEKALAGKQIVVPTLVLFEVYKRLATRHADYETLEAIAALRRFEVVELTATTALGAADLAIKYDLAMADSIVLAHAVERNDTLLTLDNDFHSIDGATVIR